MNNNLSEQEYNALVRDALRWRKHQMSAPDGWTMVRTAFYNELLEQAQIMDPGEEPDPFAKNKLIIDEVSDKWNKDHLRGMYTIPARDEMP